MNKHTTGPWTCGREDMASIVEGYEAKWIYAGEKYIALAVRGDVDSWDEVMANARLVAAAPELLDALKAMGEIVSSDIADNDARIIQARAAIAKATA